MKALRIALLTAMAGLPLPALADVTLYSGRGEPLVAPILRAFTEQTGIRVNVRYAGTSELAVLLQEEGANSPADLFWAQDAAALGAVASLFAPLPEALVANVPAEYRDAGGRWVATSGRGRVLAYSTERIESAALPATMADLTDPQWRGRIALPVTNGSFHAHVTALRVVAGEDAARAWLEGLRNNAPVIVRNNTAVLQTIADGGADIGLTNNYYLARQLARDPEFPVNQQLFATTGDIGNLLLVAGMGVLQTSGQQEDAQQLIQFLLSPVAQQYFASEVAEFPVVSGAIVSRQDINLDDVIRAAPAVDLNAIGDLEGTLQMLREVGFL